MCTDATVTVDDDSDGRLQPHPTFNPNLTPKLTNKTQYNTTQHNSNDDDDDQLARRLSDTNPGSRYSRGISRDEDDMRIGSCVALARDTRRKGVISDVGAKGWFRIQLYAFRSEGVVSMKQRRNNIVLLNNNGRQRTCSKPLPLRGIHMPPYITH